MWRCLFDDRRSLTQKRLLVVKQYGTINLGEWKWVYFKLNISITEVLQYFYYIISVDKLLIYSHS